MKRIALLMLAACFIFLPACSGSPSSATTAASQTPSIQTRPSSPAQAASPEVSPSPTPSEAPSGLVVAVTDEDGKPVPDAAVSLTDIQSLESAAAATGPDGTAKLGKQAAGSRYLLVTAPSRIESGSDIEVTGDFQRVDVQLKSAVAIKRYLMALTAVSSADKKSRVYLAQSDDGVSWEAFPGFTPFEEKGGAGVAMEDGTLYVFTQTAIHRYRISTGEWDMPRPYTIHTDDCLNRQQSACMALTREPSILRSSDGNLMLIGGNYRDQVYGYPDAFSLKGNDESSLVGLAAIRNKSQGLILKYEKQRYLYKVKYNYTKAKEKATGSPSVIVAPDGYYLLMSKNAGVVAMKSDQPDSGYAPVPSLKGGLIYAGANGGASGYYDKAKKKFVIAVSTKASLKQFELDGLTAAASGGADIDLGFLGTAISGISHPSVWACGDTDATSAAPVKQVIGLLSGWDNIDAFVKEKVGGTYTSASGNDKSNTLKFTKNSYWIYNYREFVYSAFTYAADVKPGTNTVAEGIAYCWNPVGAGAGGFVFAVDGKQWSLSVLIPSGGEIGWGGSPIKSMDALLTGDCPESAAGCTMAVRHSLGLHELYINGKKVGEYRDTDKEKALGAGFVGLYMASGDQEAEIEITAPRILS